MALNGDDLGDAIRAAVDDLPVADRSNREKLFRAMGGAIVAYLKTNAVVSPAGLPTPLTAPTGGGPVAGTGKLT